MKENYVILFEVIDYQKKNDKITISKPLEVGSHR